MTVTLEHKVGEIAAQHPSATRVFARHNIDFCCGGGRPLKDICEKQGLNAEKVLGEIEKELENTPNERRWDEAPLGELIDHIVEAFHRPLDEELPRLAAMAEKVVSVHGDKNPEAMRELLEVFTALKGELEEHMHKEEAILFPMIKRGDGPTADGPIEVMLHEHDTAANCLRRLRELTDDYTAPDGACNTWRALWHGLEELEHTMHEHIHLENNILFPRALNEA